MWLLRQFGSAVVLLLSGVGTLCCVGGITGIWIVSQRVSERVDRISDRLETGLGRASAVNQNIQLGIEKARADVAKLERASTDLGSGEEKSRRAARAIRTVIQQAGPSIDNLGGRLATLSDAVVAISSLLESFQELSLEQKHRLEPEQLKRRADEAQQLSTVLRRLEVAIGDGDQESASGEAAVAATKVELVLQRCQTALTELQSELDTAHGDLKNIKAQILDSVMYVAIGATALCVWVAAGQISLFAHAVRWCRRK